MTSTIVKPGSAPTGSPGPGPATTYGPILARAVGAWQATGDSIAAQATGAASQLTRLSYRSGLDARQLAAVRQTVGAALSTLHPYVIVNRSARDAVEMLEGRAGPRVGGIATSADFEVSAGIRRAADDHTRVLYGALHFADLQRDATGARHLDVGQLEYGDVAFVMKDNVLDRATLTPWDSWSLATATRNETLRPARSAQVETVTDSLLRRRVVADGIPLDGIEHLTDAPHVTSVRRMLTSDQLTSPLAPGVASSRFLPGTPEVQIYGDVHAADVREIRLSANIQPEEDRSVRAAAYAFGIPVRRDRTRTADGSGIERATAERDQASALAALANDPLYRKIQALLAAESPTIAIAKPS